MNKGAIRPASSTRSKKSPSSDNSKKPTTKTPNNIQKRSKNPKPSGKRKHQEADIKRSKSAGSQRKWKSAMRTNSSKSSSDFVQGEKSTVRRDSPSPRIIQLARPSKSVLLSTWEQYCNVFDYPRMKKIMDRLYLECALTPAERRMCFELMRKNLSKQQNNIAKRRTNEGRRVRISSGDLEELSALMSSSPNNNKRSTRMHELAKPKPHNVMATWAQFGHHLPPANRVVFHRKYVEEVVRSRKKPKQWQVPQDPQPPPVDTSLQMVQDEEKRRAREAAYKLVEKGVQKAISYAEQGRPPPLMTRTLIKLSDNILAMLADYHLIQIPPRNSDEKNAKFLLYLADWTAKIISDAYFATEKFGKAATIKENMKYLKFGTDNVVKETIVEQDEPVEEKVNVEEVSKFIEIETQTNPVQIVSKDVPQGTNSDSEDIKELDEEKDEIKTLAITDSQTEIIHIREGELEKIEKISEKADENQTSARIGDQVDGDISSSSKSMFGGSGTDLSAIDN